MQKLCWRELLRMKSLQCFLYSCSIYLDSEFVYNPFAAVWRYHIWLALLATNTQAIQLWNSGLHKISWCRGGHCLAEALWMGVASGMCPNTLHIYYASEERRREGADTICHRQHHVQRNLEQRIWNREDCSESTGFDASWFQWNCIPRVCLADNGPISCWDGLITFPTKNCGYVCVYVLYIIGVIICL